MASPVYPDESKKRKLNNAAESIISNRRGKTASLELPITRVEQVIRFVFERDVKDAKLRGLLYMKLNDAAATSAAEIALDGLGGLVGARTPTDRAGEATGSVEAVRTGLDDTDPPRDAAAVAGRWPRL